MIDRRVIVEKSKESLIENIKYVFLIIFSRGHSYDKSERESMIKI